MTTAPAVEYKDKFVAFIDILGFKDFVDQSAAGSGMPLSEILKLLKAFGSPGERESLARYGPTVCPLSKYNEPNLDFRLTQVSDCVIVSTEISPAGFINLLSHCTTVVVGFLLKGVMCRGYVTRGPVYHTEAHIIGTGYQSAYLKESGVTAFKREADERGTPFVEIDPSVVEYAHSTEDTCLKTMYGRMVKSDGEVSAIFPFDRLSHSFAIGGFGVKFDPDKEKQENDKVRTHIKSIRSSIEARVDASNPGAVRKAAHYLAMLDKQLNECEETDEVISSLCRPLGWRR